LKRYFYLKKKEKEETDVKYVVANVIAKMCYTIIFMMVIFVPAIPVGTNMRDTKSLENYKKNSDKKSNEMKLFRNLKKEVDAGANGTQQYVIKKGINKGKVAK
jgi:hypothetical protein